MMIMKIYMQSTQNTSIGGEAQRAGQSSSSQKRKAASSLDNFMKCGTCNHSQPSIKASLQSKVGNCNVVL